MSGNRGESDTEFEVSKQSSLSNLFFTPETPGSTRRKIEDKLEEMRLRKELMDYEYEY
ncbi:MAG: hypothetical protein K0U59_00100 [Gammaproteobacteria bacterium]|nr:hypothetical protein [Gammaproteobacteria bacterium]